MFQLHLTATRALRAIRLTTARLPFVATSCGAAGAFGAAAFGIHKRSLVAMQEAEYELGLSTDALYTNLPVDLVLVRHGQSEANIMIEQKKNGDFKGQEQMDKEGKHDSNMRLTDLGRRQANHVGAWLREHVAKFDRYYVSEYVRTKETAAELGLPQALWMCDMMIRERDQGVQDGQGDVKMNLTHEEVERAKKSPMYWAPVAGESMSDVCLRVRIFLGRLQAQAPGMKAIVVAHYRTIHAFRLLLEDVKQGDYSALLSEHMPNCCVWWYSRRDEHGRVHQQIVSCKRIVVQEDGTAEILTFQVRPRPLTNEQLLSECSKVKQILNNPR